MNMTFLNPLLLFGLAAGILPVLIHRLTQRKAVPRKFSAVRLLVQSQRVTARPQHLKHLLLLILRILAVISIVLMIARPVLMRSGLAALQSSGAKVILLDNSLSMGYRDERGEHYLRAKKAIKETLEGFEGQVMIIPTVPEPVPQEAKRISWLKSEEALRTLEAVPLSFGAGNPATALGSAYHALKDLKIPKQILIVTDLARGDWEKLDLSKLDAVSDAELTFLRVGGPNRDPNVCIKSVLLVEGEGVVGVPGRLEVTLSNLSDGAGTSLIQLSLSGIKVDQKSVSLQPGEEGKVYFELFLTKPGWIDGEVRLSEDRLPLDDVFYFSLKVRDKVKVLVVDGDPKTSLKAAESFYLVNALQPGGKDGSSFSARVVTEGEMATIDLRSYEAIFLLNVARFEASRLAPLLELGRPVFLFLGDRVTPDNYNTASFVPWRILEVKDAGERGVRITEIDRNQETLRSLIDRGDSLMNASFYRYFAIEGTMRKLLVLGTQDPLLVEAPIGKSKLFLFTSSADLDWNDFPLNASYLPLFQGLLREVVGLTRNALPPILRFGEPFPDQGNPRQIRGTPEGTGIYQWFLPDGEVRRGVNAPYEESNLLKLSESELRKKFGSMEVSIIDYQEGTLRDFQAKRKELWPFLLAFLLGVLAVEMVLANGGPWSKPSSL
jgi:hypothetical protein